MLRSLFVIISNSQRKNFYLYSVRPFSPLGGTQFTENAPSGGISIKNGARSLDCLQCRLPGGLMSIPHQTSATEKQIFERGRKGILFYQTNTLMLLLAI